MRPTGRGSSPENLRDANQPLKRRRVTCYPNRNESTNVDLCCDKFNQWSYGIQPKKAHCANSNRRHHVAMTGRRGNPRQMRHARCALVCFLDGIDPVRTISDPT